MLFLVCVIVAICAVPIQCYSNGAPEGACADLIPRHGVDKQPEPSPYLITGKQTGAVQFEITLHTKKPEDRFKGFFIQARDPKTDKILPGTFSIVPGVSQYVTCSGLPASAITHVNNEDKSAITTEWIWPDYATFGGAFKFEATMVKDQKTFWTSSMTMSPGSNAKASLVLIAIGCAIAQLSF